MAYTLLDAAYEMYYPEAEFAFGATLLGASHQQLKHCWFEQQAEHHSVPGTS